MRVILSVLLVLSVFACESGLNSREAPVALSKEVANSEYEETMSAPAIEQNPSLAQSVQRKLIKEGSIHFQCKDVNATKLQVEKIYTSLGAYSSNEGQDSYGDNLNYRHTIRVPAGKFDTLVTQLEKLATKVESKDINTIDVTEEYIDLDTRLNTKKELEVRYREILKQARNVEEIIAVEREINNVRADIESMEGRLNYLKDRVSFSTLTVSYYQVIRSDFGFWSKFTDSIGNGWENLLSFVIGVMNLWPFALLIAASAVLYLRYKKRRKTV